MALHSFSPNGSPTKQAGAGSAFMNELGIAVAATASWLMSWHREKCMEEIYGDEEGLSQFYYKEIERDHRELFWNQWAREMEIIRRGRDGEE